MTAEILEGLATAHLRLAEGQGAELVWREARPRPMSVEDALGFYALKTAPAFEAALWTGVCLAGAGGKYRTRVPEFAAQLGIAFQIRNDLQDWNEDGRNKVQAGGDILGGRPTLLGALASERDHGTDQAEGPSLLELQGAHDRDPVDQVSRVRDFYQRKQVFARAEELVSHYRQRAEAVAERLEPVAFRRLLLDLIETLVGPPSAAGAIRTRN